MGKYYIRYLIFLLPALLVSLFYNNDTMTSIILRWFFAFFLLTGFGVTTYTAAYRFPRATMSFILSYTGINLLIITMFYASHYNSPIYPVLRDYAGALSYIPLSIMVDALRDFNIQQEVYVTLFIAVSCIIGYVGGLIHRRINPYPYRPRIG